MPTPEPFALTARLLAAHGFAGKTLALPPAALGGMVQLLEERPGPSVVWALQGRRADARVWAPLVLRAGKASSGPSCEACDGSGKCAQCEGIGCSVCDMTGKCAVCEGAGTIKPDDDKDDDDEDDEDSSSSSAIASGYVRVVSVRGILASEVTPWACGVMDGYQGPGGVVARFRQAHADPQAVAVVTDAMSPGGDARLCVESAAECAAIVATSGKPSLVYASEATSAMYALACGMASPGGLYAAPSADVANVGTRTWHVDYSKANELDGVKVTHVGSPAGKILGNPDEPLPPEALARMQRNIDESTARFAAFVAERRGLSVAAVLEVNADTRRGQGAVDDGFADGVALSLSEVVVLAYGRAMAAAQPLAVTSSGTPAPEDDMRLSPAVLQALGLAAGASSAAVEAAILARAAPASPPPPAPPPPAGAQASLVALGTVALEALGGGDPVDALVELPRRLARGAAAPAVEVERDELRRERAWNDAITGGAFVAGEVWIQTTDAAGKRGKRFSTMAASMNAAYPDVATLEGRLAKLPKLSRGGDGAEARADTTAAAEAQQQALPLSPRWQALAAKSGVDPQKLATRAFQNLTSPEL